MRREVKRVLDAIDALEAISDAGERAQAVGEFLALVPEVHSKARQMRQQAVATLRTQGLSWQQIGDLLGVNRQRAKRIFEGKSWPAVKGPSKGEPEEPPPDPVT